VLLKCLPSLCVYVCVSHVVARQRVGKVVAAAIYSKATIEDLSTSQHPVPWDRLHESGLQLEIEVLALVTANSEAF
jgi:hypothetical protein